MIYIEAPNHSDIPIKESLFLAGGLSKCPNWQPIIVNNLYDITLKVYNPRRREFDSSKKEEIKNQAEWEFKYLRECTQILFWFPAMSRCTIALFELGAALDRNVVNGENIGQKLFIGCHRSYPRKYDLEIQSSLKGFKEVCYSLGDLIQKVLQYNWKKNKEIV